ncbi:ABC transporter substrate-binding protein [Leifsonia sp. NPDC056824]|uniref:ABC transporter substrate-binding protein n=1 Tax=Leifsonia sp. NPDC056824 TaxID=3345953 RepID=UPI0036A65DAD
MRSNVKKSTIRLLGAAAVISVAALGLTACGGSGSSSTSTGSAVDGKGKTLDVLVGANAQHADALRAWQAKIAAALKKQTGADIKFETFASANDELTKIQTSVVSGQGPDVYTIGTTFTPTAYSTGAFVKLDSAMWDKVGGKSRFVPASLGISGPDSKNQIGVPFASRPYVLAYNTDMFKAAGLTKPASTWDGLLAQAKKLTGNGVYGFSTGYADGYTPWKYAWTFANDYGTPLVSGKKANLDSPAVKKGMQAYFGWLNKDKVVNPAAAGWKDTDAAANFASGKSAMMLMTTASVANTLNASPVKGHYAFAVMPTVPPGETTAPSHSIPSTSIISGDNVVIASYSKNQDLAAAYVKLITSEDFQLYYHQNFGDLPTNAAAATKIESADKTLAPILDSGAHAKSTPFTGAWGDIQLALTNVVVQARPQLAGSGVSDSWLSSALAKAQQDAQSSLDRASAGK